MGTGLLVEILLERGADGDLAEAQGAFDRLANLPADGSVMREITLLRLRALLARARGDDIVYRDLVTRYREMAESLGFEGHIAWAEAMIGYAVGWDGWTWRASHAVFVLCHNRTRRNRRMPPSLRRSVATTLWSSP